MAERLRDSSDNDPEVKEALAGLSRRLKFPVIAQIDTDLFWQAGDEPEEDDPSELTDGEVLEIVEEASKSEARNEGSES